MKVAITGYTGLLGRYLIKSAPDGTKVHGLARTPMTLPGISSHCIDLCDGAASIKALDEIRPDIIMNAAAEGSVDRVQGNLERYRPLNVESATRLAQYSERMGVKFIQVSSNAVYGDQQGPLDEDAEQHPVNDYGRLKSAAELAVQQHCSQALIVRPILLYGWPWPKQRLNPITFWLKEARQGRTVSVVDDVFTQPLAAIDCAKIIWNAASIGMTGSLNVSGGLLISLFDMARLTLRTFELSDKLAIRKMSSDFPSLAPRPRLVDFDLRRLRNELGFEPMKPDRGLAWLKGDEFAKP